jgi:hypothetical protein
MAVATTVVVSDIPVKGGASIKYSIGFEHNRLKSVQPHEYPKVWYIPHFDKTFHGGAFTRLIFVSHNDTYQMWDNGKQASPEQALASLFGTHPDSELKLDIEAVGPPAIGDIKFGDILLAYPEVDGNTREIFSD